MSKKSGKGCHFFFNNAKYKILSQHKNTKKWQNLQKLKRRIK